MNKKGWGMPEMIIMATLLIVALLIAAINVKRLSYNIEKSSESIEKENNINTSNKKENNEIKVEEKKDTTTNKIEENQKQNTNESSTINEEINTDEYLKLGNEMVDVAISYINSNPNAIADKTTIIVNKSQLIELDNNLQNKLSKNECDGYVKISIGTTNTYYTPYLKCKSYTTSGYEVNKNN